MDQKKKPNHITIIAIGTRGDVQPYVALGKALKAKGYTVRIAAQSNFQDFVTRHNLEFAPITGHAQQMLDGETGQALMSTGRNGLYYMYLLSKLLAPTAKQGLLDSWEACQGTDAIIFNLFGMAGYHIAEKLKIPAIGAYIYPMSRTKAFPVIGSDLRVRLGGYYNWITYLVSEQVIWHTFRNVINQWRQETLNLPPMPFSGPYVQMNQQKMPILHAYSPAIVPTPTDWPDWLIVTGYWFLDENISWQPPETLIRFLEAGPPPVYVGFGSISNDKPQAMVELVIDALKQNGQRGILSRGWGGLNLDTAQPFLSDDIFVVDNVPHEWLFPQMAAVVHHGGAGTTSAGLRAGVPSVIIPFHLDQPFWGERIAALGVGPHPILHNKLSVDRLATAIKMATSDPTIKKNATAIGQQIRAENGLTKAIEFCERFWKTRHW
ncbi:MAG: glycosyltransferase [Chloroflexota bacterium]